MKDKPFIISVSGISGSGKTTVTEALSDILDDTSVIFFDSYEGDLLGRNYCEWSEEGADANEWKLDPIITDIKKIIAENHKYIIIDYPFGRSHSLINQFIDFAVFIDTPYDIALARRIVRDYCRRDIKRKKLDDPLKKLDQTMMFYLNRHRATYIQHKNTVQPYCDLVVDGTKDITDIADEIIKAVRFIEK